MKKKSSAPHSKPPLCRVNLLGGFELSIDNAVITDALNRSMKMWNFLTYCIIHRDRNIPQSEFIETLWPNENISNPVSALKTLLYRIRMTISPILGKSVSLIVSPRGSYSWNRNISCVTDIDEFESLCKLARENTHSVRQCMSYYEKATALYKGDFFPKLDNQLWAVSLRVYYHALYLDAVKAYAILLEQTEQFAKMSDLCLCPVQIDPLDETLYTLLIRSLLRQGKNNAALSHYETATDFLYRNLGVHPSNELRTLYSEIIDRKSTRLNSSH